MLLNIIRYFRFKKIKTILNAGIIELSQISIKNSEKPVKELIDAVISDVISRISVLDSLLAELLQESFNNDTADGDFGVFLTEDPYKERTKIWLFKTRDLINKHI